MTNATEIETSVTPTNPVGSHRFQGDLDTAESAVSVGSALSSFSTLIHGVSFILLVLFIAIKMDGAYDIYSLIPFILGLIATIFSWAVVYALLSLVVTNAISAKHAVFQSSKLESLSNRPIASEEKE